MVDIFLLFVLASVFRLILHLKTLVIGICLDRYRIQDRKQQKMNQQQAQVLLKRLIPKKNQVKKKHRLIVHFTSLELCEYMCSFDSGVMTKLISSFLHP